MYLRLLGCAFLLIVLTAFQFPGAGPSQKPSENPSNRIRWEYRAVNVDYNRCSTDRDLTAGLNLLGQDGWELASFERIPPPFPTEAEGSLLIKPAATAAGAVNNPQTADSFTGSINMKMEQAPPGGCQIIMKRIWQPPAKQ